MLPLVDLQAQQRAIAAQLRARIETVLAHGAYIHGPEVAELEAALGARAGTRHCIACASGSAALWLALRALDIGPGDEVITTPFSFVASAGAICLAGARPVFADIEPESRNIDPAHIEARIGPRTRAVLAVDLYGLCADYDAINVIAARHNLPVIEDAAQAFGALYRDRPAGGLATIGCTSFYPSKPLGGYGDGGACFSDNAALAARLRRLREHGRHDGVYTEIGDNARLDTLQAAVLLAKLEIFDAELRAREAVAARYSEALAGLVQVPRIPAHQRSAWAQYTIATPVRDTLRNALQAKGIATATHYARPLHHEPAYATGDALPVAERAAEQVLSLPMHPYLPQAEQERVIAAVRAACAS